MIATPAINAVGLVKAFDQLHAVDGVDLDVRQGEIFGVLGPNGAGKTTTLKMLATLLPIDAGQARVFGVGVAREPHRVRRLLGVTGQCLPRRLRGRTDRVPVRVVWRGGRPIGRGSMLRG